jgi:hypothetical protein
MQNWVKKSREGLHNLRNKLHNLHIWRLIPFPYRNRTFLTPVMVITIMVVVPAMPMINKTTLH